MRPAKPRGRCVQGPWFKKQKEAPWHLRHPLKNPNKQHPPLLLTLFCIYGYISKYIYIIYSAVSSILVFIARGGMGCRVFLIQRTNVPRWWVLLPSLYQWCQQPAACASGNILSEMDVIQVMLEEMKSALWRKNRVKSVSAFQPFTAHPTPVFKFS